MVSIGGSQELSLYHGAMIFLSRLLCLLFVNQVQDVAHRTLPPPTGRRFESDGRFTDTRNLLTLPLVTKETEDT